MTHLQAGFIALCPFGTSIHFFFRGILMILKLRNFCYLETKRERLKSVPFLRLKKRKTFFFWKKIEICEFFFKKNRIVPKNVKGDVRIMTRGIS